MNKEEQEKHLEEMMRLDQELDLYEHPPYYFIKPKHCSKDNQIGVLIGQTIVPKLPTLSTDMLKTHNVINVPEKLEQLWKKKKEYCFSFTQFGSSPDKAKYKEVFYKNLSWYKANIENIFLPKEIEFIIYDFYEEDFSKDMRKGFDDAIWDCDLSHYVFSSAEVGDITSTVTIKMKYSE